MTEQEALAALRGDDVAEAARAANVLWQMWHRSGDARLDGLLREFVYEIDADDYEAPCDVANTADDLLPPPPTMDEILANCRRMPLPGEIRPRYAVDDDNLEDVGEEEGDDGAEMTQRRREIRRRLTANAAKATRERMTANAAAAITSGYPIL